MAKQNSYTVLRNDLRRLLTSMHVSEKSIEVLFSMMEKTHRHINAIAFASQLERMGLSRNQIANVLRRIGIDDVTIASVFEMMDTEKISAEIGRIYNVSIKFG
ncbi:MAG: hypothetical protein ACP5K5_00620 [Candidatus Micrarchaeia archaeon]